MKRFFAIALLASLMLTGCQAKPQSKTVFRMNTVMNLTLWGGDEADLTQLDNLIGSLESTWSATSDSSLLSRLNRGDQVQLTPEQQAVLNLADALSQRTAGAFNPHMHALSAAWGFYDAGYRVPSAQEITAARAKRQWDLGGILKGYTGDQCAKLLSRTKVRRAMLVLGGNVQTYGSKPDGEPWQVGIQNPEGGNPIGVLSVQGTQAVVTSGDYQRFFLQDGMRYHHILDPWTGWPADTGLRSVTIVCSDGAVADALSTALFVLGLEKGSQLWRESEDFEAVFLTSNGKIYATEGAVLSGCDYEVIRR